MIFFNFSFKVKTCLHKSSLAIIAGVLLPGCLWAAAGTCEKVVVTGEPGWPPYSYEKGGVLQGVGVDLAEKLFGELDIPVETRLPGSVEDVAHGLRRSYIDLIVGTFDVTKFKDIVALVSPGYYEDAVSILVSDDRRIDFYSWFDLMGEIGLTTRNVQLGYDFTEFAKDYLYVKEEGTLDGNFASLSNGRVDYLIGSLKFLTVGMGQHSNLGKFSFLPKMVASEMVHFGFSLESECQAYAPYLRVRAQELKDSGFMDKLINKHVGELTVFSKHKKRIF